MFGAFGEVNYEHVCTFFLPAPHSSMICMLFKHLVIHSNPNGRPSMAFAGMPTCSWGVPFRVDSDRCGCLCLAGNGDVGAGTLHSKAAVGPARWARASASGCGNICICGVVAEFTGAAISAQADTCTDVGHVASFLQKTVVVTTGAAVFGSSGNAATHGYIYLHGARMSHQSGRHFAVPVPCAECAFCVC